MIISMSDIVCVTNRSLCCEDFLVRIRRIARCHPSAVLLREKDLCGSEYETLAAQVMSICREYGVPCILHTDTEAARRLHAGTVHLSFEDFKELSREQKDSFSAIGVSCHSSAEALEAERLGCTYLIVGHIFETDCKKDLPERGIPFLKRICTTVHVPVLAIGGINADRMEDILRAGAAGACVMSGCMQCEDVEKFIGSFK